MQKKKLPGISVFPNLRNPAGSLLTEPPIDFVIQKRLWLPNNKGLKSF